MLALLALLWLCSESEAFVLAPRRIFAATTATATAATATTTARGVGLCATSQIGGNWSDESSMPADVASLILDASTPLPTRRLLLSMQAATTTIRGQWQQSLAESQQSLAELQMTLMKTQEQERDLQRLLREAVTRNAAMNPRAVVEYVENFVMPSEAAYAKTKDRREKWETFLKDETTNGPNILKCLREEVPTWNTATKAAAQISNLYSYTSEGAHVTSYEIADNPMAPVRIDEGPALLLQGGKAMLCIGKVLGIGIELIRK